MENDFKELWRTNVPDSYRKEFVEFQGIFPREMTFKSQKMVPIVIFITTLNDALAIIHINAIIFEEVEPNFHMLYGIEKHIMVSYYLV